ncbi:unnamed protein product [Rhizoctonia solani]|uniref:Uncharacterized protein n=1 Tax=Rhizoctonia solani TaxID=456999 RepID=A0A8H2WW06_9AGAM|nr:unnamed protein product [Rhizoctonia solani]
MKSGQLASVLRRSSRIRAARQKSNPTAITTNGASTESVSTPRDQSPAPPQPEKYIESLTSVSQQLNEEQYRTTLALEESFASQMTLDGIPSTPQKASTRKQHNLTTYKRRRTMRTRSASVISGRQFASPATIPSSAFGQSVPMSPPVAGSTTTNQVIPTPVLDQPEHPEPFPVLDQVDHRSVALNQPVLDSTPSQPALLSQSSSFNATQSSTHSCSPVPAHLSHRRKRRRRLPPLKNRLAKIARPRLSRQSHPETLSQPPAPALIAQDEEYGEEEIVGEEEEETKPVAANVTQRRLAAPENFTIPDLKDLVGYKAQPRPPRTPAPRFILPQNTVRPPRSTQGSKSPYKRKPAHTPRLKFVALEAHHEQATTRSGNTAMKLPLTPQTSPVRKNSMFLQRGETEDPVQNFSNRRPEPSPCRVLVKGTPEFEEPLPKLPSIMDVVSAHLTPEPDVETQPTRTLAPMSELYDNLMKLARSAEQMGRPVIPESSSLKRKLQSTLTPQLAFEVTQPTKVARLQ